MSDNASIEAETIMKHTIDLLPGHYVIYVDGMEPIAITVPEGITNGRLTVTRFIHEHTTQVDSKATSGGGDGGNRV